MKTVMLAVLALSVVASQEAMNPISKVIQMLSDLEKKVIGEGEEATKVYGEFSEWCEDRSRKLGFEIKTGEANVAELKATIDEETSASGALTAKIDELAGSIATDQADLKAATQIRKKEEAAFAAEEKELTDIISTLERAIAILSREMAKGASMLQLQSAKSLTDALNIMVEAAALNSADASKITALIQSGSDEDDAGAPDAAVYESHSANIVDTLNKLLEEAEGQLADARKKESTNKNNFELLKQSLEDGIKFAESDKADAEKGRSEAEEKKSAAEGDLEVTQKDLDQDLKDKKELHHQCMEKASQFEAETKSRGEELSALAQAKKVIKEKTGGAEEQTYDLAQVSFMQLGEPSPERAAIRFVRDLARKHSAPLLAQLASRMAAASRSSDPFAKVTNLIEEMIKRLEEEAAADATEKAYCDKEMKETEDKKAEKEAELDKLNTKIDQQTAASKKLKEQVAALQKALADLAASQAEMDKIRAEEKAAYDKNRPEMEAGVEGVKTALSVLRDYYSQDGKDHAAAEGAASGIIGLLEVAESDFSKGLAEMIETEESAVDAYTKQTKENQVTTAEKTQDVKYKNQEAARLDKSTADATSDRDGVQQELDSVLEYYAKIKERCVAKAETYAERKAARDQEIAGLNQALEILSSESALVQTSTKRSFLRRKAKLDINQKVYIENAPVLGDGAGDGALNQCRSFTAAHVANPAAPVFRVCGTGIKATVYLRNRCEEYYEHSHVVGKCDSGMPPSTCDEWSPANDAAFGAYQSYKIEQC